MGKATFRFYAELIEFIPESDGSGIQQVELAGHETVKHLIEALGVPHTEVDLLLVNSDPVSFDYLVRDGDLVSVYPVFEVLDIKPVSKVSQAPLRIPRFVNDTHLGKLAGYLRLLGFDTLYRNDYQDEELAATSADQKRILLTRDRGLLKRKIVTRGYLVRADDPQNQIIEVLRRFDLAHRTKPYSRCSICNGLLEEVEKESIIDELEELTKKHFDTFKQCPDCGQIYWRGSHFDRMEGFIQSVLKNSCRTFPS